jgi:hypothetical protein
MRRGLPTELSRLLPADVVQCHHEAFESPAPYQLWIFRHPHGSYLDFPVQASREGRSRPVERRHLKKGAQPERHELPASVLTRILAAKAPWVEPGRSRRDVCRFTHWSKGEAEYRVRELVTDRGWFASVEEFRE